MAIFCDLPVADNEIIDVYAILRTQLLSASKKKYQLQQRLAHMVDPGQIRFYKKRVKYTPKDGCSPRIYEYNQHYLRISKKWIDKNGCEKVHHATRFLTNKEYAETKRDAVLYRYLSESLKYITELVNNTRRFILSSFNHHPDDIPDLNEEEINAVKELDRALSCRKWHDKYRLSFSPDKYKCLDGSNERFMSRGELLLHDAFLQCGLTPQYETRLEIEDTITTENLASEFGMVDLPPKVFYPDFKCNCAGKTYYIEYFGMMNDPAYFKDACKKMEAYLRCGIVPGHNFIAFCSGDSSAIHMKPALHALKQIASGRSLLQEKNISMLPGIIRLDNIGNWSLPASLSKSIIDSSSKYITKKHKYKSSSNRSFVNKILKKGNK
ncbi:MAG: hypothetical protein E7385_02640 [Ruminococcaceae bacterium]|nr:hypothetical protein [Oscillospiraceae bacterium]